MLPLVEIDSPDPRERGRQYGEQARDRIAGSVEFYKDEFARKTGMTWDDIQWFVPHQANLRINEKVAEVASIPRDKVLNTIEFYGNTTAATVPLTIDHWRREGKVKAGDRILSSVFGSGFTWGAAIFTV